MNVEPDKRQRKGIGCSDCQTLNDIEMSEFVTRDRCVCRIRNEMKVTE